MASNGLVDVVVVVNHDKCLSRVSYNCHIFLLALPPLPAAKVNEMQQLLILINFYYMFLPHISLAKLLSISYVPSIFLQYWQEQITDLPTNRQSKSQKQHCAVKTYQCMD